MRLCPSPSRVPVDRSLTKTFPVRSHSPLKIVRQSLINASGVASLLFTTEACVVDAPEEKGPAGAGGMPGGGMGGMGGGMF